MLERVCKERKAAVCAIEIRKFDVFVCYEKLGGNWDVFKNRYRIAGSKCVYELATYLLINLNNKIPLNYPIAIN